MKAFWNDVEIASSDDTVVVEGNHYFPEQSIKKEYFRQNERTSHCPWKGDASYYDIVVGEAVNEGGAWYYAEPKPKAAAIAGRVAFWQGVIVTE